MPRMQRLRSAFTIVELLVAMGILAILIALLLPAIQQARENARRTGCRNQLHQIGVAMQNYLATHKYFPPGGVHMSTKAPGTIPIGDEATDGRAPWTVLILPQLDELSRYNSFNFEAPFSCVSALRDKTPEPNRTSQYVPLHKYTCVSAPDRKFHGLVSHYAACQGGGLPEIAAETSVGSFPRLFFNNGVCFTNSKIDTAHIGDGTSNTILVGESKYVGNASSFVPTDFWWPWSAAIRSSSNPASPTSPSLLNISATVDPINFPQNGQYTEQDIVTHQGVFEGCGHGGQQRVYGSWHAGGASFLMADGSVHFLNENMDVAVYRSLGARNDGGPKGGWGP